MKSNCKGQRNEIIKSVKSENPCLPARQACKFVIQTSYDIVKTHGGELKVESMEGKSTEFIIHLPNV